MDPTSLPRRSRCRRCSRACDSIDAPRRLLSDVAPDGNRSEALARHTSIVGRILCMLVLALALAACTHGASSGATQGPTPSGPETPPPPRTVVINKGGTHVYPLSKIAPGDEVVCIAGGGGG